MRKLGRTSPHRKSMLSNMATSLLRYERITTTLPRARELRRVVERLISKAKKNTLASRREAGKVIKDKEVLRKLFSQIGPKFKGRSGGYTRILRLGQRKGDNASLALIELVEKVAPIVEKKKVKVEKKPKEVKPAPEEKKPPKVEKEPFFKRWFRMRRGG
jgi:large subunit ribosomal protein L17